jgi:hypothetical protein
VLQELRDYALSIQRDEQFRIYLLRRLWLVIPIAFVSVLIGSACAVGTMYFLHGFVTQPAPGWSVVVLFGVGALVWFASIISQIYALLAWLHRRAFSQSYSSKSPRSAASLVLIAGFVVLPLLLFALFSVQAALVLVAAGICVPIALSLFDR